LAGNSTNLDIIGTIYADTFFTFDLIRIGKARWLLNDGNMVENTSNYYTGDTKIRFRSDYYTANQILTIDWVFARKYNSPEPTWGTWGAEQTPP